MKLRELARRKWCAGPCCEVLHTRIGLKTWRRFFSCHGPAGTLNGSRLICSMQEASKPCVVPLINEVRYHFLDALIAGVRCVVNDQMTAVG